MLGRPREYILAISVLAVLTLGGWFAPLNYRALGNLYLLVVIAVSLRISPVPAFVMAVVSGLAWNYVFMPPKRLAFSTVHLEDSLLLITYLVAALVASQLASLRSLSYRAELLAASDRLHRTLLASVSHELKTPLAILRAAGEQVDTPDAEKRRRVAHEMGSAVHRLDGLVNNILNQMRLEAGTLRVRKDWCDVRDLVDAACRSVGERLQEHPLNVGIPGEVPLLHADAFLMEQVLANLLLNAAVHTPAASPIHVSAGTTGASRHGPGRIFICVADEGPGIAPDVRGRLFERFERGPHAPADGLGLGLMIVRGFMLAQGGEVEVQSAPGIGCRFTVSLPAVKCEELPQA
ncbi:MAG TPA: ATP-binding protein [Opitutaceae bacterium]|jgi:two-component system sensor histidine kinase KdpD|nr:ATP-binding protein [Opitutaceae bacterium]